MNGSTVGVIVVAVLATVSTIYTQRQVRKAGKEAHEVNRLTHDLDDRKVDAEAYDRAQAINSKIVENLQSELTRLQGLLNAERQVSTELRQSVQRLEDLIRLLKRALDDAHIPIPPEARNGDGVPKLF